MGKGKRTRAERRKAELERRVNQKDAKPKPVVVKAQPADVGVKPSG